MYGYIYKTTNVLNGNFYVGKHKYDLPHIDPDYYGSGKIIRNAIQKYGIEFFVCEILEWCDSAEELNQKERFWIKQMRLSSKGQCYNIANGGDGGDIIGCLTETEKESIYTKRAETWEQTGFRQKCSDRMKKFFQENPQHKAEIRDKLREYYNNNPSKRLECAERQKGKVQSASTKEKRKQSAKRGKEHPLSRPCICIETQQVFDCIKATQTLTNSRVVHKCCKGLCETAGGYHWAYTEDKERIEKYSSYIGAAPNPLRKQVKCVETNEVFSSAAQAAQKIGCNNLTILNACKSGKASFGYHWAFVVNLD